MTRWTLGVALKNSLPPETIRSDRARQCRSTVDLRTPGLLGRSLDPPVPAHPETDEVRAPGSGLVCRELPLSETSLPKTRTPDGSPGRTALTRPTRRTGRTEGPSLRRGFRFLRSRSRVPRPETPVSRRLKSIVKDRDTVTRSVNW